MKKSAIDRRTMAGLVWIAAGLVLLLTAPLLNGREEEIAFRISGYGASLPEQPGENQIFSYSLELSNNGSSYHRITSVEPVITQELEALVLEDISIIPVDKKLSPHQSMEIEGDIRVNTSRLNPDETTDLLYGLHEFKVVYDHDQLIIMDTGIRK